MASVARELLDSNRYPFRYEVATRFADVDPNWHINNVAMAGIFEDARFRFHRAIDLQGMMSGRRLVIVSAHYEYIAETLYPEPIAVYAAVLETGRTSWTLTQVAEQDGRACAYCQSVFVSLDNAGKAPLPDLAREILEQHGLRAYESAPPGAVAS